MATIEERWKEVLDAIECNTEGEPCLLLEQAIQDYAVSVLEAAETGYAQNYAGANEGDAVAASLFRIRARIAALGTDTARQELIAEREMVQAQMPVVNEDGGR